MYTLIHVFPEQYEGCSNEGSEGTQKPEDHPDSGPGHPHHPRYIRVSPQLRVRHRVHHEQSNRPEHATCPVGLAKVCRVYRAHIDSDPPADREEDAREDGGYLVAVLRTPVVIE